MRKIFLAVCVLMLTSLASFAQTVENASRSTIGYVNSNGTVENSSRGTIGYAKGVETEHAAAFFFFFLKDAK